MANDGKKKQPIKFLFDQWQKAVYAKSYTVETYCAKSEQCYHLPSTDADTVAVRLLLPLHRKRHIPESYSIVCIFNLVFDPMTLKCCFCF